jgi:hypothetical protein
LVAADAAAVEGIFGKLRRFIKASLYAEGTAPANPARVILLRR